MEFEEKQQMQLHHAVSMIGGFFGGYAIIGHCDIFANAQTANLIHMVKRLCTGELDGILFLLLTLVAYVAGNAYYVVHQKFFKTDIRLVSLIMDFCIIVLIGLMPSGTYDYIMLLPIFFVTPIQWNAYRVAAGYVSSTIFSSNNVRQTTISLVSYIIDKDKKQLNKFKFYGKTLLFFHIGVAGACLGYVFMGLTNIWLGLIPITASLAIYVKNVVTNKVSKTSSASESTL